MQALHLVVDAFFADAQTASRGSLVAVTRTDRSDDRSTLDVRKSATRQELIDDRVLVLGVCFRRQLLIENDCWFVILWFVV